MVCVRMVFPKKCKTYWSLEWVERTRLSILFFFRFWNILKTFTLTHNWISLTQARSKLNLSDLHVHQTEVLQLDIPSESIQKGKQLSFIRPRSTLFLLVMQENYQQIDVNENNHTMQVCIKHSRCKITSSKCVNVSLKVTFKEQWRHKTVSGYYTATTDSWVLFNCSSSSSSIHLRSLSYL